MPERKTLHFDLSKETGHQQAVIAWAAQGATRKRMGVKKGVPDLCLPVQRGGYAGLYLEMKRPGGHVREEQHWWLEHLDTQGYCTAVCYGWEQARGASDAELLALACQIVQAATGDKTIVESREK